MRVRGRSRWRRRDGSERDVEPRARRPGRDRGARWPRTRSGNRSVRSDTLGRARARGNAGRDGSSRAQCSSQCQPREFSCVLVREQAQPLAGSLNCSRYLVESRGYARRLRNQDHIVARMPGKRSRNHPQLSLQSIAFDGAADAFAGRKADARGRAVRPTGHDGQERVAHPAPAPHDRREIPAGTQPLRRGCHALFPMRVRLPWSGSSAKRGAVLDRQLHAPARAPSSDHLPAAGRRHARAEAKLPLSRLSLGLPGSLHPSLRSLSSAERV